MATSQTDAQNASRALDETFVRHANARDAAAFVAAVYAADAKLLPPNAPVVSGTEAIHQFWQGPIDAGGADVILDTTDIDASGELAYGIGQHSFTMPSASGGRVQDQGKYLVVFRRQADGSWEAVADMFSSNEPAG